MHAVLATPVDDGQPVGWIWRLEPKRPVRTVPVVVRDVEPHDHLQVASANDQEPVQALGTHRPHPTLRIGARTGVTSTSTPSEDNTSSKLRENFASRSRMRRRSRCARSPSTSSRLRACWVTQAPFGLAVTPARWTRRVSSSMKNSTYNRRSQTVSMVKKSHATIPAAC
jgi:hypothetical protein